MNWSSIWRTLVAALIVIVGALLPLFTVEFFVGTGVSPAWAYFFAAVAFGLAAWWRKQSFEPDNPANLIRTLMQGLIVVVGVALGLLSAPVLMSLGVSSESAAGLGGAAALALAAWWRQKYPQAFDY